MLISLILLMLIALGGMAVTYLIFEDEPLMWRLCAGSVIGSAFVGTIALVICSFAGFSRASIGLCLALNSLPILLLTRRPFKANFLRDWQRAKGKLEGANVTKLLRFVFYAAIFVLLWLFFSQAIYEAKDGIYTGGSQNLGDLPFHLGAIFAFTDSGAFPPQNPSFVGAKFAYPFIADLLSAIFVRLGVDVKAAIIFQDIVWTFSLAVLLERFTYRLTSNRLAGRLAPWLLFLSGGLGFYFFFKDYWASGQDFISFLGKIPHDYTITDFFRWGNPLVVLFMTQRSILLGMPLTIIALQWLWSVFSAEKARTELRDLVPSIVMGLASGTLVLVHLHSLAALFVTTACLFLMSVVRWREWIAYGVSVAVIALPELVWTMIGSATDTTKFIGWNWGWDKGEHEFLWFWVTNTGLFIPVLLLGIFMLWKRRQDGAITDKDRNLQAGLLLKFYIPFALLLLISNTIKLAPWSWDNIKVLIYWFIGSIPIAALVLASLWQKKAIWAKVGAVVCIFVLVASGSIDVWRTVDGQIRTKVFDDDAVRIAEQIRQKTDPQAIFLNAPTYNSPVVLTGRRSVMRYSGHLASYGIDYLPRENDVRTIYTGSAVADMFLRQYGVDYVLVSPEERNTLKANEAYFSKYPVIAESGPYRVYKIK